MTEIPPSLRELVQEMRAENLVCYTDEHEQILIDIGPIHVWISARPPYCDRGRWLVNAKSIDPTLMVIDHSDAFPRYYFHNHCLIAELYTWLHVRLDNMRQRQERTRPGAVSR